MQFPVRGKKDDHMSEMILKTGVHSVLVGWITWSVEPVWNTTNAALQRGGCFSQVAFVVACLRFGDLVSLELDFDR